MAFYKVFFISSNKKAEQNWRKFLENVDDDFEEKITQEKFIISFKNKDNDYLY